MADLTVQAEVGNLPRVLAFVDAELDRMDCSVKARMQIDVAVEELFVNVADYAYADGEGSVTVRVEAAPEPGYAEITILDRGIPYDPLAKEDPDVTLSAGERQIGGLGIFMVKKSMDGMRYERRDGQNILTVYKKLR